MDDSVKKKVPELRFPGFTYDWEERKLSDIADRFDNLRVPITASDRKPGDTPYYGANGIQDYVEGFTHNGEFILVAEDGANDLKNYPVQYVNGKVWVNNHAHVLQGKKTITDNKFLMNAIKNFNIEPFLVGGGRAKLNADVMMKLNILLPTFVEQEKIGSLFSLLDKTIALHQRKLDLLKEQKKGYLQKMFPKNGAKVPELRFAGFADDWEQRKLGDISYKVKEKNKTGEFTETLTNSAEYGIINQRDFFDKDISNAKNLTGYYVVKNDDFVYNPRISNFAPVGPIKRNKLGRTGVMSPLYYVFRTHDIDKNYFEKYFDTVYWHRFMELNGDSGARADRFAIKDSVFVEMPIPYPTMDEQQKIGSFFKQLDDTIALHQCKLDLLKEQKKGFLQKMFV
ncbi:restriction endonuclease subunit S (plasmid) [Lactococcus lactis subsp. lactis]|uniref:Restriction endonuclease subunit S n=1 Tax=Lactococcus lactis subsp. lactis TaxID=1360 RepID=A0AAJ6N1L2_LACLL|nr:restriction endonuclease subunit S [Lactococcus lactis]WNO25712.1 restriction endonuclease subunit S [Lactococcus lactis subsp. lactis]WNO25718.1 restriction endonuclease subunit S [Lactococcus lactis subsp. lactis]